MGIHGIYKEIGAGRRVALSKFSCDHYLAKSRPLRLAIDISIWLFQIQSGKGGSNPALRTFYYRLVRLISLNIHPLFVFDGPNKPSFKRNKRVGGPNVKVSSIPEFLAKQLLKQFAFPAHLAPGEAEAECALLQRQGIVDAVLSEDVDTLMFGSAVTMRNWTPCEKSAKSPTHVNVYDSEIITRDSGIDPAAMILVALMSGGDYIVEGISGCGPKIAIEAARAGFGKDLVAIARGDKPAYAAWRDRLKHELETNESKFFRQKHKALVNAITDDFPNLDVLGYYTRPCVSSLEKIERLRTTFKWDLPLDLPSLRTFAADAFDWTCLEGAKHFVRKLAPALLVRDLRLGAARLENDHADLTLQAQHERKLIAGIHGRRNHATTDNSDELRVSFVPLDLVNIDLDAEEVNDKVTELTEDDDQEQVAGDTQAESAEALPKTRGPMTYDPTVPEKQWLLDTFVRLGAPLAVQDWEAAQKAAQETIAARQAAKQSRIAQRTVPATQNQSIDRFMTVTKTATTLSQVHTTSDNQTTRDKPLQDIPVTPRIVRSLYLPVPLPVAAPPELTSVIEAVDLSATPKASRTKKRQSPDMSASKVVDLSTITPKAKRQVQKTIIELLSSPASVRSLPTNDDAPEVDLPESVSVRRRRSPFRRHHTAPGEYGADTALDQTAVDLTMSSPRAASVDRQRSNHVSVQPHKVKSPRAKTAVRKKHVVIRHSLEGAWKLTDLENDDVTEESPRRSSRPGNRRVWRQSEVEIMDMTT